MKEFSLDRYEHLFADAGSQAASAVAAMVGDGRRGSAVTLESSDAVRLGMAILTAQAHHEWDLPLGDEDWWMGLVDEATRDPANARAVVTLLSAVTILAIDIASGVAGQSREEISAQSCDGHRQEVRR